MVEIIRQGLYTTIQDLGRFEYQEYGVPLSGALDQKAFRMGNQLLNNPKSAAALECSFKGPKVRFHQETSIVLTGAEMQARLNNSPVKNYTPIKVLEGDVLDLGTAINGCRTYLNVAGGFQTEKVLGSRSQYRGITKEERIHKKVLLPTGTSPFVPEKGARVQPPTIDYKNPTLTVYPGPEYHLLKKEQRSQLVQQTLHLSELNDRMAFRIQEKVQHHLPQIWTAAVLPGTLQCSPDGTLILLMRDAQVTGGYPRLLQLTDDALDLLAQKTTRATLRFKLLSLLE